MHRPSRLAALPSARANRAFGVIEADSGEAAVQIDQAMAVSVAVCDPTIETCSNAHPRMVRSGRGVPKDYDCAEGLRCPGTNRRLSKHSDREVIECPPGQVCERSVRGPQRKSLPGQRDCPDEHNCINGRCIERNRQCGEHDHCPMHQLCNLNGVNVRAYRRVCAEHSPCQLHCVIPAGEQLGRCVDCERDDVAPSAPSAANTGSAQR